MSTKINSAEESHNVQSPISKTISAAASGPKASMFGVKSGFVIPRNKLSGSLVPIVRGGGKVESGDAGKEDTAKQVHRKTRWGADPIQDAAVRKGRSLAYQTRLEQITQQLKSGLLELAEDAVVHSPKQAPDSDSMDQLTISMGHKRELLELEKQEIIGEILRLNPAYKPPSDYKPLLKEAKVPIPLKAHPGNTFIELILGPASNTQKRLEEETGAKLRVYGIKIGTKEKCEIARSDATEAQAVYEELFVHITADTHEKVDAAVALIELLFTPALPAVASAAVSSITGGRSIGPGQDSSPARAIVPHGMINHGMVQPMVLPARAALPQFHGYAGPWHQHSLPGVPTLSAGFVHPPVSSSVQFPPPVNILNLSSSTGYHALSSVPSSSPAVATRPESPMQNMQRPGIATHLQQRQPAYPVMSAPPTPMLPAIAPAVPPGLGSAVRPLPGPQPASAPGGFPYRPLGTALGTSGFQAIPSPRPNNVSHMIPPSVPFQKPQLPLNNIALPTHPSTPVPAVNGPTKFSPRAPFPHQSSVAPNLPSLSPIGNLPASGVGSLPRGPLPVPNPASMILPPRTLSSSPGLPISGPVSASPPTVSNASPQISAQLLPAQSSSVPVLRLPATVLSLPSAQASVPSTSAFPSHRPVLPISGSPFCSSPSFSQNPSMAGSANIPPMTSPKPPQPSPGDFTFQPHRSHVSSSITSPMPNSQPAHHIMSQNPLGPTPTPLNQNVTQQPLAPPKVPSFRPAQQNPPFPMGMIGLQRPQNLGPGPLQPSSAGPPGNSSNILVSPRLPALPNPVPPGGQMGLQNFSPSISNIASSMPPRPTTLVQTPNNPLSGLRPHIIPSPSPVASSLAGYVPGKPAPSHGGSQIYDPFSPTSISSMPRQLEDGPEKARKPETDAEYEDLMASVGVR